MKGNKKFLNSKKMEVIPGFLNSTFIKCIFRYDSFRSTLTQFFVKRD